MKLKLFHEIIPCDAIVKSPFLSTRQYLILRCILFLLSVAGLAFSWAQYAKPEVYILYLSNWSHLIATGYFTLALYLTFRYWISSSTNQPDAAQADGSRQVNAKDAYFLRDSFIHRLTFVMQEIAITVGIIVTIMYWVVLFDGYESYIGLFNSIQTHGVTMIVVGADFSLNGVLVVATHYIYILLVALLYIPINAIYTKEVGPVYDILTWDNAQSALFVIATFVISSIAFACVWLLSRLKIRFGGVIEYGHPTSSPSIELQVVQAASSKEDKHDFLVKD